ncbi:MAG: hypothetical protein JEY94_14150 [Melioribacteraceae bacterium]|nr:hypothetical protein [Melioribacteraceae bacterium]
MFKKIFIPFFSILLIASCDNSTNPQKDGSVQVDLPLGKKAVYATATYIGDDNKTLMGLEIYSIIFNSATETVGTNELVGIVEADYKFVNSTGTVNHQFYLESGPITVSVSDSWIEFQQSDVMLAINIFMKKNIIYKDTTRVPDKFHSHFPAYPRIIESNKEYSILRPEQSDDDFSYIALGRKFSAHGIVDWKDNYGNCEGIYMTKDHNLYIGNTNSIKFKTIVDEEGIIISQYKTTSASVSGTVTANIVTRRIVDFTEPENVKDLSYYVDLVYSRGIKLIDF